MVALVTALQSVPRLRVLAGRRWVAGLSMQEVLGRLVSIQGLSVRGAGLEAQGTGGGGEALPAQSALCGAAAAWRGRESIIGVDELAWRAGHKYVSAGHKYVSLVVDPQHSRVVWMGEGKREKRRWTSSSTSWLR